MKTPCNLQHCSNESATQWRGIDVCYRCLVTIVQAAVRRAQWLHYRDQGTEVSAWRTKSSIAEMERFAPGAINLFSRGFKRDITARMRKIGVTILDPRERRIPK